MVRAFVVFVCGFFVVFTVQVVRRDSGSTRSRVVVKPASVAVGKIGRDVGMRDVGTEAKEAGALGRREVDEAKSNDGALPADVRAAVPRKLLRVGWNNNPPRKFWSEGARGFLAPVLRRVAEVMDFDVSFEFCALNDCLAKIRLGELDAVVETMKNPRREEFLEYLPPEVSVEIVRAFYQRKGEPRKITGLVDLGQMKVGVLRGQKNFEALDQARNIRRVEFGDVGDMVAALESGGIDAFVGVEDLTDFVLSRKSWKLQKASLVHRESILVHMLAIGKNSPLLAERERLSRALESLVLRGEVARLINTARSQM